ncbi:MAG: DUF2232 domain-containing protein [Hyphomicrobiales bacterium]|nr:DUF2232 domain-containing protein [Hyphomicrobiales bacterium]
MKRDDILMGVGAGLVSAVLFATVIRGSLAGVLLFYLTPLPIAIVSLGWKHRAGLVASTVGAFAVALLFRPLTGLLFAVSFSLPTWWLAFLSLLAREAPAGPGIKEGETKRQWYPLGALAIWSAGLSIILTFGLALTLGPDYSAYRAAITELVQAAMRTGLADGIDELSGLGANTLSVESVANFMANYFVPGVAAAASTLLALLILLVAAKLVSLSGRLSRPLPQIAHEFVLPRATLFGLAGSFVLMPFGGWPRFVAIAIAGAVVILFAMQGLATAHVLIGRVAIRPLILGVGYTMILIAEPWTLISLALLGLADMVLSLRARSLDRSAPRSSF